MKNFKQNYSAKEKEKFTEISDRLVEDLTRRYKGEFYTPTIWVDESQKLVSKTFPYREMLLINHPEYHLNSWNAGWYQINIILKAYEKK